MPIVPVRNIPDMSQTSVARRLSEEDRRRETVDDAAPARLRTANRGAVRVEIRAETEGPEIPAERRREVEPVRDEQAVATPQPLNPSKGMINLTA